MEFFEFVTAYEAIKRSPFTALDNLNVNDFYKVNIGIAYETYLKTKNEQIAVEITRQIAESNWYKSNKPYYKVWSDVIPMFNRTRIDIPIKFLQLPFPAFLIRFPTKDNILKVGESHLIRSILVSEKEPEEDNKERDIYLWIDIGEIEIMGVPMLSYSHLRSKGPDQSIEDAFKLLPRKYDEAPGIIISDDIIESCMRITTAVCLLATGADRIVQPDVLSKDFKKYRDAKNDTDKKTIEERAVRRGKLGWNVGEYERYRPLGSHGERSESTGTGKSLQYSHMRSCHIRILESGKATFVKSATVRPDLPPPPTDHAYKVD